MSNNIFISKLKKSLYRNLPQSSEYRPSRRVEGALERNEETTSHEFGVVIVDDELTEAQSKQLCKILYDFLSKDKYFKKTKYRTMVWKESAFAVIQEHGPSALCSVVRMKTDLDCIKTSGNSSSDWENFREIYKPHKRAGQVILITTQEKIDLLEQAHLITARNLITIYPCTDSKERRTKVKNIPCIPYEE